MQNQNKANAKNKPSALMLAMLGGILATSTFIGVAIAQTPPLTSTSGSAATKPAMSGATVNTNTGAVSTMVESGSAKAMSGVAPAVPPLVMSTAAPSQAAPAAAPSATSAPSTETLPVLQMGSSNSAQGQMMNGDLAEYTKLLAEKRKLELMKDIAKLRSEKEEYENGGKAPGKAGAASTPKDLQLQIMQMQAAQANAGPSQEQLLYESIAVLGIFGGGGKFEAKIFTNRGSMLVESGQKLPTGEIVQDVKPGYVQLTKGKVSRKLTPTAERPVSLAPASNNGAQQGQSVPSNSPFSGAPPQMIPPFNPADLLGSPPLVGTQPAAASGGQKNGL
jgi:hypothetical protein